MHERLNGFLCELRRRKVYRVAVAYAVVGWLVIQIAAATFPALQVPVWATRLVILAVLLGFPIALMLAWAFDIGPHGLEESLPSGEECPPALSPRRRNVFVLALTGALLAAVAGYFVLPRLTASKPEKSIAVLPFENFSEQKENEYLADGIQDDLLTNLAKIGDLKVISRTSVASYKGKARDIREIGRALGAGAILEGSVRRDGNRLRVNVQLINAASDAHLWAEVYERELTDVFAMQSALAQEIAAQLKAKLSSGEHERIDKRPTENGNAYLAYMEAHEIFGRPDRRHDDLARAEALFEKAIQLDPSFALAHARLSQVESWMYYAVETSPARMNKARAAADEAMRLQPDLPEAHLARSLIYYYVERDYARALSELQIARAGLPNDPQLFRIIAAIQRRQGKWNEAAASYTKAASLAPKDPIVLENMGSTFLAMRDYARAGEAFERGLAAVPDSFILRQLRARVEFDSKGDLRPLEELLAKWPENVDPNGTVTLTRYNVKLYERQLNELVEILQRSPASTSRGETSAPIPRSFLLANVYKLQGDEEKAREAYEEARGIVEGKVRESPDDAPRHALLGLIYGGLGRCEEAAAEGERAVELLPETKDALDGPILALSRARIAAMCGDHDRAIALLTRSLQTPAGVTLAELRYDPSWDPLRKDARFQQLVAAKL